MHDACWILKTNDIIYLKAGEAGRTEVHYWKGFGKAGFKLAEFDAALSNLKLKALDDGTVVFMVTALADDAGILYNDKTEEKPDSGRLFKNSNVRIVSIF